MRIVKKNDFLESYDKGFFGKFINDDEIISGRIIFFKNVLDGDFEKWKFILFWKKY